ncbi:MAG: glutathione S-transferase family protein [Myxococcota bacterium]
MLKLYQFDYSSYCIKIRAILNVKALDYTTIELIPGLTQHRARQISGQSKVPVLVDGQTVIVDSTEIALYLDTAYPSPQLIPDRYDDYKTCLLWEDWADEALVPAVRSVTYEAIMSNPERGLELLPPYGHMGLDVMAPALMRVMVPLFVRYYNITPAQRRADEGRLERYLNLLAGAVASGGYLIGDRLTLADIAVAASCRSLNVVASVHNAPHYQGLFTWCDRILAECLIPAR